MARTQVPEVFLDFSPRERAAKGRMRVAKLREKKPLVTLDLNPTFMQTPAVKVVKFIITKGTNGNSVITCLSATNFF